MVEPSKTLQAVFDKVVKDAIKLRHEYVTLEHLLYAMLCETSFADLISGYGTDIVFMTKNREHNIKYKLKNIIM